jgi:molecular chaperone DnaK
MPCTRAVVTVPAHEDFDIDYRGRIRQAAMSGEPLFDSIATIPEPDAVLLSMADISQFKGQTVLVFDMGGGTLDVSIRNVDERDAQPYLTQRAIKGSDAAGKRVTEALSDHLLDEWQRTAGFTFTKEERLQAMRINHVGLDQAKRFLSSLAAQDVDPSKSHACKVYFPGRGQNQQQMSVSVATFSRLAAPICDDAVATVEKALAKAGMSASEVDAYFMVGGSSQLPMMRSKLMELFDDRPPTAMQGSWGTVEPTLAVARGAALDDLERIDERHVPDSKPVLERRLPYAISLLVDGRRATKCLVPIDSPLPYGPVTETLFIHGDGDTTVSIELVRGAGHPADCVPLAPHTVEFPSPKTSGDPIEISWLIDDSGELTVTAFDDRQRELAVIRSRSVEAP